MNTVLSEDVFSRLGDHRLRFEKHAELSVLLHGRIVSNLSKIFTEQFFRMDLVNLHFS